MKANELRIGNLVYQHGVPPAIEVIRLSKDKIIIDATPIPLTEEWLVKLNFKKVINEPKYNEWHNFGLLKESICIEFDDSGCYFTGGEGIYYSKNIKYVHSLQNFYFALTGEELVIR